MTISANTVFEVQTGGSDDNGGGFVTGASGTDFTYPTSSPVNLSGVTTAAANAICLHASAATTWVGNIVNIISGTNFTPGLYEIKSVVAGVSFTVDRNCTSAAGSLGVINVGGAFATPGYAAPAASVAGNLVWVKAGTYTLSTSTPGAGGPVVLSAVRSKMEGYTSTRGDRAGRPVVSAGAITSVTIFTMTTSVLQAIIHMQADGNSQTGVSGFSLAQLRHLILDCYALNCDQASAAGFLDVNTGGQIIRCGAYSCTTGFKITFQVTIVSRCWADACATGFSVSSSGGRLELCAATDCTGDGFGGPLANTSNLRGCTAEGNGGDGFDSGSANVMFLYCAATNNAGYGFNSSSAGASALEYCASYNNSARTNSAPMWDQGAITLSGDPWVNAASDDLRPDATAGEGASLRNGGGGVYGQTDNRDIGAVQHADPTGGISRARAAAGF